MRCVQDARYGYIVNFWSDGEFRIRGDALNGRSYSAMNTAAFGDTAMKERMNLYKFRVA